jgi:hypothetical protein
MRSCRRQTELLDLPPPTTPTTTPPPPSPLPPTHPLSAAWSVGGIHSGSSACNTGRTNHAMLATGYDTGSGAGLPHWIIKVLLGLRWGGVGWGWRAARMHQDWWWAGSGNGPAACSPWVVSGRACISSALCSHPHPHTFPHPPPRGRHHHSQHPAPHFCLCRTAGARAGPARRPVPTPIPGSSASP